MLNSLAGSPAALPCLAPPAAPPAPQSNVGAEPRAFARELERARPKHDAPVPQPDDNAHANPATSSPAKAPHASAGSTAPPHRKAAATADRNRTEPALREPAQVEGSATDLGDTHARKSLESEDANKASGPSAEVAAAADPGSLLATLMAPATMPALAAHGPARTAGAAEARTPGARHLASAQEPDGPRMPAPVEAALAPGAIAAEADAGTGGPGTHRDDHAKPAPATNPGPAEAAMFTLPQPVASVPAAPAGTATAPPTPYAAQIAAPVGSPDFAPGLSAQLSVMVRDGLQEARLHLNPAEMGPITVQIQIEGNEAQVSMAAEQASTRQALEHAMPTLASALREGGLTLTGGGVFEQAPPNTQQDRQREQAQTQRDAASSRRASGQPGGHDALVAAAIPTARAGSRRGVLDLYA